MLSLLESLFGSPLIRWQKLHYCALASHIVDGRKWARTFVDAFHRGGVFGFAAMAVLLERQRQQ